MFWQLFGTSGLLVLFSLTFLGWIVSQRVETNQLLHIEDRLRAKAILVQEVIRDRPTEALPSLLKRVTELQTESATRITIIGVDGRVLAETASDDPSSLENHGSRPEVLAAASSPDRIGVSFRDSATLKQKMIYVALCTEGVNGVAYVRVALPLTKLRAETTELSGLIWTTAALTAGLSLVLAFWLVRGFLRPLQELSRGADRIALGDYSHRIDGGGPQEMRHLAESFNNMSERLSAQFSQLEEDRQQLRTVLSSMVEGVIAVDSEQRILFANDRAGLLLDFPAARVVGRHLGELLEQRADVKNVIRDALKEGSENRRELIWNGPGTRSLAVHVARLPGTPTRGAVLVFHDNSELRRLENLRQEFAANVSHELKTPLSTIKACVETLLDGAMDDPTHRLQFLEQIADQSDRLHRLILDLLHLSRIESETEVFTIEELDLEVEVAACLERHRTLAESKNQKLLVRPPPGPHSPVMAWADEEAVQQILDNLVDNALKYTPEGGSIYISWGREDKQVFLEVRDTGIGIPDNELPRIFERFYRVDKARSRELGGTGLGLSIVKHLTQAMKGSVQAQSKAGKGTVFTVRLPLPA
jgi:two-component system, OmpR family, phosphate regulon sensor histidine kinase PhoR